MTGAAQNWQEIDGPDMPIVLHFLAANTDLQQALSAHFGMPLPTSVVHPDMKNLAAAVLRDPLAAPDVQARLIPKVVAYGETLPITCDISVDGRHLNRRVELWITPKLATNTPAP